MDQDSDRRLELCVVSALWTFFSAFFDVPNFLDICVQSHVYILSSDDLILHSGSRPNYLCDFTPRPSLHALRFVLFEFLIGLTSLFPASGP